MKEENGNKSAKPRPKKKRHPQKNSRIWIAPTIFGALTTVAFVVSGLHGLWHEWWVEWFLVPGLVVTGAIGIYELVMFLSEGNRTVSLLVGLISFSCFAAAAVLAYKEGSTPHKEITSAKWQPPELPDGCKWVAVTSGVSTFRNPTVWPKWSVMVGSVANIVAYVTSNRFYVDANVTWQGIDSYTISNMTFVGTMPPNWDRNSDSNAFEIVGPDNLPVFQEVYALPEHVILNGIFPVKPGIIMAIFGGRVISGTPQEVLTNLPARKPIFKYPSWKFPGVLAK